MRAGPNQAGNPDFRAARAAENLAFCHAIGWPQPAFYDLFWWNLAAQERGRCLARMRRWVSGCLDAGRSPKLWHGICSNSDHRLLPTPHHPTGKGEKCVLASASTPSSETEKRMRRFQSWLCGLAQEYFGWPRSVKQDMYSSTMGGG